MESVENATNLNPQWQGRMDHVERDLPRWLEWIGQPHPVPARSPLAGDDKLWPKWPVSKLALQGLISTTDHLSLLTNSTRSETRPVAQFTLARAALFAAARSVWILAPNDRKTRQTRAMWVAYEDFRYLLYDRRQLVSSNLGKTASSTQKAALVQEAQDLVDEVKQIAQSKLGLTLGGRAGQKIPSDTEVIEFAARYVDSEDDGAGAALLHAWRVNSGHAHSLSWPALLKPAEVITTTDGLKYQRIVGDEQDLAYGIAGAWLVANNAFRLYNERSTPI